MQEPVFFLKFAMMTCTETLKVTGVRLCQMNKWNICERSNAAPPRKLKEILATSNFADARQQDTLWGFSLVICNSLVRHCQSRMFSSTFASPVEFITRARVSA
jgi:hypothetical protein